jgi:hypothetical protein
VPRGSGPIHAIAWPPARSRAQTPSPVAPAGRPPRKRRRAPSMRSLGEQRHRSTLSFADPRSRVNRRSMTRRRASECRTAPATGQRPGALPACEQSAPRPMKAGVSAETPSASGMDDLQSRAPVPGGLSPCSALQEPAAPRERLPPVRSGPLGGAGSPCSVHGHSAGGRSTGSATPRSGALAAQCVEVKAQDRDDSFRRHQVGPYSCMHGEPVDECV